MADVHVTHKMVSLARTAADERGNINERQNAAFTLARLVVQNASAAIPDESMEELLGGREPTDRELLKIFYMTYKRCKEDQEFLSHLIVRISLGGWSDG